MTEARTWESPYRFSTKEGDEKAGLYYFGARYYSPEIGRWTQRDPAGVDEALNLYLYAGDEPVGTIDPWGLICGVYYFRAGVSALWENLSGYAWGSHYWVEIRTDGTNVIFGLGGPGAYTWPHASPTAGGWECGYTYKWRKMWDTQANSGGTLEAGDYKGTRCCDAAKDCPKIYNCMGAVAAERGPYNWLTNNCLTFAKALLSSCCLEKGQLVATRSRADAPGFSGKERKQGNKGLWRIRIPYPDPSWMF